jgi:hypothetical protein
MSLKATLTIDLSEDLDYDRQVVIDEIVRVIERCGPYTKERMWCELAVLALTKDGLSSEMKRTGHWAESYAALRSAVDAWWEKVPREKQV